MRSKSMQQMLAAWLLFGASQAAMPSQKDVSDPGKAPHTAPHPKRQARQPISIRLEGEKLVEGWKEIIRIPKTAGITYCVAVQDGWLHVERRTDGGALDWHVVLAQVSRSEAVIVSAIEGATFLDLSYASGRYFIRDNGSILRSVRQRKTGKGFINPRTILDKDIEALGGASVPGLILSGWRDREWMFVASGPDENPVKRVDAIVRLNPLKMAGNGYGVETNRSPAPEGYFFHGDKWLVDDGELLVAMRTVDSEYKAQVRREKLIGAAAPSLRTTNWLNTNGPLSWGKLEGNVVLLDFWGTWCGPCVKKLPDVQEFAERYHGRGVVVIGMHSAKGGDACPDFVKKAKLSYPIGIDSGETATSFGVSDWPSVFVIDKSGRVVARSTDTLPSESEIEKLLEN
jgi:thiol-disulfide isomerase/thioredoxin